MEGRERKTRRNAEENDRPGEIEKFKCRPILQCESGSENRKKP
jgi:hypothetical protein